VLTAFEAGIERSFAQDGLLAFRLLNDIGLRALSTAINDPFTAIQALDAIEDLLRTLANRQLAVGVVHGSTSHSAVLLMLPGWEEFLQAGIDELAHAGRDTPTVRRRLQVLLDHLIAISPSIRRPPLERRRTQVADPIAR
jgi:uncharacterized membrane protein